MTELYTTRLGAGQGMIEETRIMLDLWQEGMDAQALNHSALQSGRFPKMSARRLRNFVLVCFKPRYLKNEAAPALATGGPGGCSRSGIRGNPGMIGFADAGGLQGIRQLAALRDGISVLQSDFVGIV